MIIKGITCLSHIVHLQSRGEILEQAVAYIKTGRPKFACEGMAGCIEVDYEIAVLDLQAFAKIWSSWYGLSSTQRLNLYGIAKGLGGTCP